MWTNLLTLLVASLSSNAQIIPMAAWKRTKPAAAIVQGPVQGLNGTTSVATGNFASSVTVGNTIVCALSMDAAQTATFSDSKSNTYTIAMGPTLGTCNPSAKFYIAYAPVVTGGTSFKVTGTFSGSIVNNSLACYEVSGLASSPVDASGLGTGGPGTSYSAAMAVNYTKEFLLAYVAMFNTATPNGGWTGTSLAIGDTIQYKTVNVPGSTNITGTLASSDCYDIPYAGFKSK